MRHPELAWADYAVFSVMCLIVFGGTAFGIWYSKSVRDDLPVCPQPPGISCEER